MDITIKYKKGFAFIKIGSKNFNYKNAKNIEETLYEIIIEDTNKIILDLSLVKFMGSRGLGVITKISNHIEKSGGEFKVCALLKQPYDLIKLLGLDKILDIYSPNEFKIWTEQWNREVKNESSYS